MQRADIAMYSAKSRGVGHEVYSASRDGHSRARLALIGELPEAIESGQIVVHYQPKFDLADRRDRRRRGARALGAPAVRPARPGRVPAARRADRPDAPADPARARRRARPVRPLARRGPATSPSPSTSAPRTCSTSASPSDVQRPAREVGRRPVAAAARDHRDDRRRRPGARDRDHERAPRARHRALARRLRHRLLARSPTCASCPSRSSRSTSPSSSAWTRTTRPRRSCARSSTSPTTSACAPSPRASRPKRPTACSPTSGCDYGQGFLMGRPMPATELTELARPRRSR